MAAGLQVFSPQGTVIFDTNDNVTRIFGTKTTVANTPGSLTDANFASGRWFAATVDPPTGSFPISYPTFTFNSSTNTLSWSGQSYNAIFIYGVY